MANQRFNSERKKPRPVKRNVGKENYEKKSNNKKLYDEA